TGRSHAWPWPRNALAAAPADWWRGRRARPCRATDPARWRRGRRRIPGETSGARPAWGSHRDRDNLDSSWRQILFLGDRFSEMEQYALHGGPGSELRGANYGRKLG